MEAKRNGRLGYILQGIGVVTWELKQYRGLYASREDFNLLGYN